MSKSKLQEKKTISSATYGDIEVCRDQIYNFKKGLIGIERCKDFALFPLEDSPFFILHSTDEDEDVSFILAPAEQVVSDYEFDISSEAIDVLKAEKAEALVVFLIVHIIEDGLYVNLKAPILLSPNEKLGLQFIIMDKEYPVRQQVFSKEIT
jgi:flagellar assembly factor FliW